MQSYGTTLWDPQEDRRNSWKQKAMMRIGRSALINGGRRFRTLTWMYKRPLRRYQGCASIQYRKNFLLLKSQPNGTQKNPGTRSKDVCTLQNFAANWNTLDKIYGIQHRECKNVSKYIRFIKDESTEINDLKISISEGAVIYILNNYDSHF